MPLKLDRARGKEIAKLESEICRLNDELIRMKVANIRLARNQGLSYSTAFVVPKFGTPSFWQRARQAFRILTNTQ